MNKSKKILSMTFHGLFALLWLMVLPGIVIVCFVNDILVIVPALSIPVLVLNKDRVFELLERIKEHITRCIEKYSIVTIAVFLMTIQIIIQAYVGYEMAVTPAGDRNIIFKQASEMALNNVFKTSEEYNFYFLRYPNNQFLLMLETIWFMILKAAGTTNFLYGNMVLNIFVIDLAIILCMIIVYKKYGKNPTILFQIMAIMFVPFYTYIPFVYTDTLVLPIVAGLVLCYELLEEYWNNNKMKFFITLVIIGVLTWAGYALKPTVAIITLACFIHMIIAKEWKKGIIASFAIILVFGICLKTFNITMEKMEVIDQTNYDKENFPYSHWIMMGLQGTGNYSLKDREYTSSFKTKKEKEKANIAMIKKRLREYGVKGLLLHQYIKSVATWSNGKYDMEFHLQRQPKRNSWLQTIFFKDGIFYPLYDGYCTIYQWIMLIFIMASIIYGFKRKETDSAVMWKLALFGLFLFLSIWETKSRYIMQFVPVMFLITVDMLVKIQKNLMPVDALKKKDCNLSIAMIK